MVCLPLNSSFESQQCLSPEKEGDGFARLPDLRTVLTHVDVFILLQTHGDVTTYADVPLDLTRVLDVRAALAPLANHNLSSFVLVGSLATPSPTTMEPVVLTSSSS
jgi:hypothetical protein